KINPQHLFQFFRPSPVARLGIVRLDQRTQFLPRHHLLHLFQEHAPPSLLRVPLESRHHRQCPLLAQRVHAGTTLSVLAVEREDLIRVSLKGNPRRSFDRTTQLVGGLGCGIRSTKSAWSSRLRRTVSSRSSSDTGKIL